MKFGEIPPNAGGDENPEEKLNDNSMEEKIDEKLGNPEEVEGTTEEQQREEAEKIQDNFRGYAKKRREIAEDFDKGEREEYKRAYDIMTSEIGGKVDEIKSFLQEGDFAGVRKKAEKAEWDVKNLARNGKEWLGAGIDFVKVEIIPLLDKILEMETVETFENTVGTMEKKVLILKRLIDRLENEEGSNQEIIINCNEALSVLKKARSVIKSVGDKGEISDENKRKYLSGYWGVEDERELEEIVIKNGGEVEQK